METTWAGGPRLGWVILIIMAGAVRGDEPATAGAAQAPPQAVIGPVQAEADRLRGETAERLKRLAQPSEPAATAANKGLREVLEERLHWLDEWDKSARARKDAEPGPEHQTTAVKADLERVKAALDQSAKDPRALLPGVFRNLPGPVGDATVAEMKEAIDAAGAEIKDWSEKLEKLRATATNNLGPLRVERDKIQQRIAALKARGEERAAAVAAAKTPDELDLARERQINFTWESRVESLRLEVLEARAAAETARAELTALCVQDYEAHAQLTARTHAQMQQHYRELADVQERELKQAAASEQKRAARADDPLVKDRARRTADLLELQAQVLRFENALTTNPSPALEEQKRLADHAVDDFAGVQALLDDGKVSHLEALRMNNDFRRIGPERARIMSHELATAASRLTYYENTLSSVELDLINDARDDRLQDEDLLARLPRARHAEARAVCQEIESKHLGLLERKRQALEKLAERAEETHRQIERRLKTLDDQYGFIRTHIFYVRDQEPIGPVTLAQCRREAVILGRALVTLVAETRDHSLWGRVSPEFAVSALALLSLPWPLSKLRRSLCPERHQAP